MIGIFAACVGVPVIILSMAYLAWFAARTDDGCPCDVCRQMHPAGRGRD